MFGVCRTSMLALLAATHLLSGSPAWAQPTAESATDPVPPQDAVTAADDVAAMPPEATSPSPAPADPVPSNADASVAAPAATEAAPAEHAAVRPAEAEAVSEAELEALVSQAKLEEAANAGPDLRIYGFADFGMSLATAGKTSNVKAFRGPGASFFVGNLNTYLDADLTKGVRSLAEIRFSYLPNGSVTSDLTRQRATALDYADNYRSITWGGIEIERAWIEYSAHNLFAIRAGQYLTPYGIWNVDHGSPTVISVARPYVIGEQLLPERQTGFQVYGSHTVSVFTFGYNLTLSNGRGAFTSYIDLDKNKAIGGRVYTVIDSAAGRLQLGLSGYRGRRTDADLTIGSSGVDQDIGVQYDEVSYGGDIRWTWKGLHIQAEALANEIQFTDRGRPPPRPPYPQNTRLADFRRWGAYGLLGYRTPWLGLMPFTTVNVMHPGSAAPLDPSPSHGNSLAYSFGLNLRPIAALALKVEYEVVDLDVIYEGPLFTDAKFHLLWSQIAWSF